ncbi:MAG: leucine-rich repeat domain-containing protein [Clostridia bacterium]|nr:leucine-rich repeat domain-containing protein [Clostridia bacterium]
MSKIKRTIAILLAVLLLVGAAPLSGFVGLEWPEWHLPKLSALVATKAQAADPTSGSCGDNLTWSYNKGTKTLTISGTGAMKSFASEDAPWQPYRAVMKTVSIGNGVTTISVCAFMDCTCLTNVTIPNSVTSIGDQAFWGCTELPNITIPNSVKRIGDGSFCECFKLTSIVIPNSVKSIASQAFNGCSGLTSVTIGNGVTSIGYYAFSRCRGLTSITIPNSVKSIDDDAFYSCGLTSFMIPNSVTSIGFGVFSNCDNLTSLTVASDNSVYHSAGNCIIETKSKTLIAGCKTSVIPEDGSVSKIAKYAFGSCSLVKITIPNSVLSIGKCAFMDCYGLTSVTIPDSVTSIGDYVFKGCTVLTDVYYTGSAAKWKTISIGSNNDPLLNATIHYNSSGETPGGGGDFIAEFFQKHVVDDYKNKYSQYSRLYSGDPMDGTCGNPDYCIPGLSSGDDRTPQGMTYYAGKNWILISAYDRHQKHANVIYALDAGTGKFVAQFNIYNKDGSENISHIGGIAATNYNLYLTDNNSSISYIPLSLLTTGNKPKSVTIAGTASLSGKLNKAETSYLSYGDGYLWTGNFYEPVKYNTPASSSNKSLVLGFKVSGASSEAEWNNLNNFSSVNKKYKIPNSINKIQSAVCNNGVLYLVSSYGRTNDSAIYKISGTDYSGAKVVKMLPMAEGMFIKNDELYLLFESGAFCYRNGDNGGYSSNPTDVIWKFNLDFSRTDIYNMGDETYQFSNYGFGEVDDSFCNPKHDGHCFGMSVTSSGYYLGYLNKTEIGGNDRESLYSFSSSAQVRAPICHYYKIQGSTERKSIVAGGYIDLHLFGKDTQGDWEACVNYVKNHQYDNKGSLQVGSWYDDGGGHAVNFLYYKEVAGQQRIYVYDNNFPEIETYYYMGLDGMIYQAPECTSPDGIVGLDLMDLNQYFSRAEDFKQSKYLYGNRSEITVKNADVYPMKGGHDQTDYVMFEIPDGVESVTITPLVDNATFEYCDLEYAFNCVDDDTYGVLTVSDENSTPSRQDLVIYNAPSTVKINNYTESRSVDYKTTITFTAITTDAPDGATVHWFVNDKDVGTGVGETYTVKQATADYTVQAKLIGRDGTVLAESEVETVNVNTGFFARLVAFFRSIFGSLPVIVQTAKETL